MYYTTKILHTLHWAKIKPTYVRHEQFVPNFIKLSAEVPELLCSQLKADSAENNIITVVSTADSKSAYRAT